ncbi:DUF3500 domain-containing protein [Herbiconiux moechotypicola]|uniref:DUF3500 domain-containing protein n=1 Tax=Herbiconiux moechotypicola TaxID=637393 RepID=A0ABN3DF53_9MICO|nr:DUF3500 domain-containing protein [Herbiconiux moechotypicola]MCS5729361.1 DUF3500 domain-containing protein [Herbiconiux moechotypicola]
MTTHDDDIDGYFSAARVTGRAGAIELPPDGYRDHLYDLDDPVLAGSRGMDYEEFSADRQTAPFLQELLAYWDGLYREPFVGITIDGQVREGLYRLADEPAQNDIVPVEAARRVLELLTDGQRELIRHDIDSPEWRAWSNPEFVFHRVGLRLEALEDRVVEAVLEMVRCSLSPEGYDRVREAMALNGFLGDLVDLPRIMNDRSYWVSLFGDPSSDEPWGWQLFGHHVAVNVVFVGGRQVVAPVFLGAEPALSDGERPPLFEARERLALDLAESFTPSQRAHAVVYDSVLDPAMPEDRLHPADERHVAGAFRDNRVVPYEGASVRLFSASQKSLLLAIVQDFLLLLTSSQRSATLHDVEAHLDETWFSWYGATDGTQPFYFRIQSPVVLAELDHHAGVWLSNRLPARFHVHTTLRLPNGNDYGKAYLSEWRRRAAGQSDAWTAPVSPDADSSAS